ncbi:N-acylneuraminate cytidylyltransferase-like [Glandiceps talaboti]
MEQNCTQKKRKSDAEANKVHIACVIPARGGSKGIRLKNIKILAGQPLISWALRAAIDSEAFDSVWVSTEHPQIARVSGEWGGKVHDRDPQYAQDKTLALDTMREFSRKHPEADFIMMLQCTSPCVHPWMLREPCRMIREGGYDSVFGVTRYHLFRWRELKKADDEPLAENFDPIYRPRRQDWDGELFENGQFYLFSKKLLDEGVTQGGKIGYYEMDPKYSVDIDTELDWQLAEQRVTRYGYFGKDRNYRNVKLAIFDVDGVVTDNQIHVTEKGEEFRSYNCSDLEGIRLLKEAGIDVRLISESDKSTIKFVADRTGCTVEGNVKDKLDVLCRWVNELELDFSQVTYMGNDASDIDAMRKAGLGATPADAQEEARYAARYISTNPGGRGAVRQFCDHILKIADKNE